LNKHHKLFMVFKPHGVATFAFHSPACHSYHN
jgi:hypothetical protein